MGKRKAEESVADSKPSKKQAIGDNGRHPSSESFRAGLFEEDAVDELQKQYNASEP